MVRNTKLPINSGCASSRELQSTLKPLGNRSLVCILHTQASSMLLWSLCAADTNWLRRDAGAVVSTCYHTHLIDRAEFAYSPRIVLLCRSIAGRPEITLLIEV